MKVFLEKLKSRKFLSCVAGVVIGICMIFGLDTNAVNTIAGAITTIGSIVSYIIIEGKIDANAVDKIKEAVDKVEDAAEAIDKIEG